MLRDEELLGAVPDFLSINTMLKATPAQEGGRRFVYFQASNEKVDQQGEIVLAKALEESSAHYLRYGNLDIDHLSLLGKPNPATGRVGLPNPEQYEIGRPVQVRIEGKDTFVKAELFQGDGELARNANMVWESMTSLNPPAKWYPSVGGGVVAKSIRIEPETGNKIAVVEKVRWTNVALSRTPVNQHIPDASIVPFGALAKCWGVGGLDIAKALAAGYATDAAAMTGGQALSMQSLDGAKRRPRNYFDLRERLSSDISKGKVKQTDAHGLVEHCVNEHGLPYDEASEHVERFMRDLKSELTKRSTKQ